MNNDKKEKMNICSILLTLSPKYICMSIYIWGTLMVNGNPMNDSIRVFQSIVRKFIYIYLLNQFRGNYTFFLSPLSALPLFISMTSRLDVTWHTYTHKHSLADIMTIWLLIYFPLICSALCIPSNLTRLFIFTSLVSFKFSVHLQCIVIIYSLFEWCEAHHLCLFCNLVW